jgi:hypothetical protein
MSFIQPAASVFLLPRSPLIVNLSVRVRHQVLAH